jgi:hypothetical protein
VLSRFTRSGAVLPSSFGALLPRPRNEPLFVEFSLFLLVVDGVLVVLEVPKPSREASLAA